MIIIESNKSNRFSFILLGILLCISCINPGDSQQSDSEILENLKRQVIIDLGINDSLFRFVCEGTFKNKQLNTLFIGIPVNKYIPLLQQFHELQQLILNNNSMIDAGWVSTFSNLRVLNLSMNNLRKIPDLSGMKLLRKLSISFNKLSGEINLDLSSQISELDLQFNKITSVTFNGNSCKLDSLNLDGNPLSNFDNSLFPCTDLKSLQIFADSMTGTIKLKTLPELKQLQIRSRNLNGEQREIITTRGIELDTSLNTPEGLRY